MKSVLDACQDRAENPLLEPLEPLSGLGLRGAANDAACAIATRNVPPTSPPSAPTFFQRHGAKFAVSALITGGLVYALKQGGLKFIPDGGNFNHVRWWTVPAYFASLAVMSYFRAARWRYLLRSFADVPTRKLVSVSWIGFAAILLMPLRIGEFVRPYMIRSPGRRDSNGKTTGAITMSAATGTIVAERVIDGLYISIVLAIALVTVPHLEPLPKAVVGMPAISVAQFRDAGFAMLALFIVAFIVIAVYYVARDFAQQSDARGLRPRFPPARREARVNGREPRRRSPPPRPR